MKFRFKFNILQYISEIKFNDFVKTIFCLLFLKNTKCIAGLQIFIIRLFAKLFEKYF